MNHFNVLSDRHRRYAILPLLGVYAFIFLGLRHINPQSPEGLWALLMLLVITYKAQHIAAWIAEWFLPTDRGQTHRTPKPRPSSASNTWSWARNSAIGDGIKALIEDVRERLGTHPSSLRRALEKYPRIRVTLDSPKTCINASSVPFWHELGAYSALRSSYHPRGTLNGWHFKNGFWTGFSVVRPEYRQIARCEIKERWSCDVKDIHGFAASKSDLWLYSSTDEMARARCRGLIDKITPEKLAKCLEHDGIRSIQALRSGDHFTVYQWDKRLWFMNSDGSHRTAAAKYIATRLGQPVSFIGDLHTYSIDQHAIDSLRRDFEMFAIRDEESEVSNAFSDAMCAFRATWLWHRLPRPYEHVRAVLLPRSEERSMRVAVELRNAGITDLGAHLEAVCASQSQPLDV